MENPIRMDDLGVPPHFRKPSYSLCHGSSLVRHFFGEVRTSVASLLSSMSSKNDTPAKLQMSEVL